MPIDLASWVATAHLRRPKSPSRRQPHKDTHLNDADNIERYLKEDGHRTWGWVIYRCTYGSDDDWNEFMQRLNHYLRKSLEFHNGLDMLESLDVHVFDDPALFDGAATSAIRQHFKQWVATAPQREQGTGAGQSQRYEYCLQVDAAALRSVLEAPAPPEENVGEGFVNLIWQDWTPESDEDTGYEAIEGCTKQDVGWMRISYGFLIRFYCLFRKSGSWYGEYRRPPEVGEC